MMVERKRRPKKLEVALALMLQQASDTADSIVALAPDDRAVDVADLRRVETFVVDAVLAGWRQSAPEHGISPLAVTLLAKPFEDQFRQAFSARFYAAAPLAGMEAGGHA